MLNSPHAVKDPSLISPCIVLNQRVIGAPDCNTKVVLSGAPSRVSF